MDPALRLALAQRRQLEATSGSMQEKVLRNGLVEVAAIGVWTVDGVDEHFRELERKLDETRRTFGIARVLVNLSKSPRQTPEIADRVTYWTDRIYRPEDRVAILVGSDAMRDQMKRAVLIANFEVFVSEVAARLWLYEA